MDIIRAWKDEGYRNSLSEAERAALPENPAGIVELSDEDMQIAWGGTQEWDGHPHYSNHGLCQAN
jgi:mersacidin/lichenicidin family type 2 lantibiotic